MMEAQTKTSVEENLKRLYELQLIDRKLDKIRSVRGELPIEVSDLEDEIEGMQTRVQKVDNKINELNEHIEERRNKIKEAQELKRKYQGQQDNVKNNREYLALSKEIELQDLEVMASEKKIKDYENQLEEQQSKKDKTQSEIEEKQSELSDKKEELDNIIAETEKEEATYNNQRQEAEGKLEQRLINAYNRIRSNFKNGLAVATIQRESCGGCFSVVPPQRQLDVAQRKKIILCENCGRILIDDELARQVYQEVGIDV